MESDNFRRHSLFLTCFIGHCLYYLTRKSLTFSVPTLMEDSSMMVTKEDFGLMASLQMLSYSAGKFLTGLLVDRYSNRKIFCFGLFTCGVTNLCFGIVHKKLYFFWIVLANGFFQAFGWNAIAVLINQWYDKSKIGNIWSLLSSTINIGTSLTPFVIMYFTEKYKDWRIAFIVLGITSCTFSLIGFFTIKEEERIEPSSKQIHINKDNQKEKTSSTFTDILTSRTFWMISSCYLSWSLVKVGTEDWLQLFLLTEQKLTHVQANFNVMVFQIGGFISSLISGAISDILVQKVSTKIKGNARLLWVIVCTVMISIDFIPFISMDEDRPINSLILSSICFMLGFCCYGPHTLMGLIVMESAPPQLKGTTHSLSTTVATIGSVFGGYPLAYISSNYGWDGAYFTLMLIAAATGCLCVILIQTEMEIASNKKKKE